MFKEESKKA